MSKEIKTYDPKVLRKLQKLQVEMLKEFIEICEKNKLDWFIHYGTAIGVIRHKGFIPWDDDIDICMSREHYNRFAEIVSQPEYTSRYSLVSAANSDSFLMPEAHWQLNGTKFIDKPSLGYKNFEMGIFLDLFIMDNLADDEKLSKKQMRDCFIWGKLMTILALPHPIVPFNGVLGKLVAAVLWVMHYLMVFFRISPRWLYRKYTEASTRFNNVETKYVTNFRVFDISKDKMTHDDIYPLRKMPFEDVEVYVINHVEKALTARFGDYMKLPPEEKRHNHLPEVLDFGTALEDFGISDDEA